MNLLRFSKHISAWRQLESTFCYVALTMAFKIMYHRNIFETLTVWDSLLNAIYVLNILLFKYKVYLLNSIVKLSTRIFIYFTQGMIITSRFMSSYRRVSKTRPGSYFIMTLQQSYLILSISYSMKLQAIRTSNCIMKQSPWPCWNQSKSTPLLPKR